MTPKQTTLFEGIVIILVVLGLFGWFIIRSFSAAEVSSTVSLPEANLSVIDPDQAGSDSAISQIATQAEDESKYYGVPVEFPEQIGKDNIFE